MTLFMTLWVTLLIMRLLITLINEALQQILFLKLGIFSVQISDRSDAGFVIKLQHEQGGS